VFNILTLCMAIVGLVLLVTCANIVGVQRTTSPALPLPAALPASPQKEEVKPNVGG
jgi:hypothetical protein